ncbi:hypothetical protein BRADI_3g30459v3 [Brachypodium distachyon]|uniref:Uncharacterized protein n=1 Tax=Brachypodium distachyon TaxID=15368 RepID=A0A2K2D081_BRADI|nr:hypothetical protein BRADI_3g30459v3 [Brachypodium distachyon]
MVAVEVLLSTLGPNFTCWVGATQKFNGLHHITLYKCTPHNRLWSVNSWQRLTCRSNDSSPSWTLNNLGFLLQQKMVLLPAITRIMPVHAFL